MKNSNINTTKIFNLKLANYLLSQDCKLIRIESKTQKDKILVFIFENDSKLKEKIIEYTQH